MQLKDQVAKFKQAYEEAIAENQVLHEELVEISQEMEELEQELEMCHSDIAVILAVLKEKKIDMQFVSRLKTVSEEEEEE